MSTDFACSSASSSAKGRIATDRPINGFGACHAAEIPFVFDTAAREDIRPLIGDTPSQAVADQAHRVWVDFITHGNPGWAPYDAARRTTGVLTETVAAVDDPAGDERALWDGIR